MTAKYSIPSEKEGRIAQIDDDERTRLRGFLLEFCMRLNCGKMEPEEIAALRKSLTDFANRLECPNPEHATELKPAKKSKAA
jgi:hypothetical protein